MASMSKDGRKRYRIQFAALDGSKTRKRLRIHNVTARQSRTILQHIENIISARRQGVRFDDAEAAWLSSIPDAFHAKLAEKGLVDPREVAEEVIPEPVNVLSLASHLDEYKETGRTANGNKAADGTQRKWRATITYLKEFFGADRDLASINHDDGYKFWQHLLDLRITDAKKPMAENTIRKHVGLAQLFFNGARKRKLIELNPFEFLASSTKANRARDFNVTQKITAKLIKACPDDQWKLLIALWRYAGLRKMEPLSLNWVDVLWDQGRMKVHATKTSHHEGKGIRYVPLRDIRPFLDSMYFDPNTVDGPIITRFSSGNTNLDKPFRQILHRAGVTPWPKLFQNMRASCETDWLSEGHPEHVVAGWMGHSVKVQRAAYAQITDGHFDAFNAKAPALIPEHPGGAYSGAACVGTGENTPEHRKASPKKTLKSSKYAGEN